jgi:hypothetical protein
VVVVDVVVDSGTDVAGREEVVVESMGADVDGGTEVVTTEVVGATDVVLATVVVVEVVDAGGRASTPTSNWE